MFIVEGLVIICIFYNKTHNIYQRATVGGVRQYIRTPGENTTMLALTSTEPRAEAKNDVIMFELDAELCIGLCMDSM